MYRGSSVVCVCLIACVSVISQMMKASTLDSSSPSFTLPTVQSVAVNSNNVIVAGTFGEGIFASRDGGKSWSTQNNGLTNRNVLAIVVKGREMILAGTFGGGVFRSEGENALDWAPVNSGLDCLEITCLSVDARGDVYAGTSSGRIYRSGNAGDNWAKISDEGQYVNSIATDGKGLVLIGTSSGIHRSSDYGDTWRSENNGLSYKDVWSVSVNPDGNIFAATNGGGVYRSIDGAMTWTEANHGLKSKNAGSIAVCPTGRIFIGTTAGVFVSSDEGDSWSNFDEDRFDRTVRCLTVGLGGQLLVGTQTVNVFSSELVQPLPEYLDGGL